MLAALDPTDYGVIGFLIAVLSGGGAAASVYLRPSESDRLRRIERKLDALLERMGVTVEGADEAAWQALAKEPGQKIAAIKAYREATGAGLADAKAAVEAYMGGNG